MTLAPIIISIVSLIIASNLAVIRIIEFYRNRFRIQITHASGENITEIAIHNISPTPITIYGYKMFWAIDLNIPLQEVEDLKVDLTNITIASYQNHLFEFDKKKLFSWHAPVGASLYIELFIVGKRKNTIKKIGY